MERNKSRYTAPSRAAIHIQYVLLAAGLGGAALLLVVVALLRRRSSGRDRSRRAHEAAQDRDPPVEIGVTYEFGVNEFTDHHSGSRAAVGKVEEFVVFAEDIPDAVDEDHVIRATVLSFDRGRTSADVTFVGTA